MDVNKVFKTEFPSLPYKMTPIIAISDIITNPGTNYQKLVLKRLLRFDRRDIVSNKKGKSPTIKNTLLNFQRKIQNPPIMRGN